MSLHGLLLTIGLSYEVAVADASICPCRNVVYQSCSALRYTSQGAFILPMANPLLFFVCRREAARRSRIAEHPCVRTFDVSKGYGVTAFWKVSRTPVDVPGCCQFARLFELQTRQVVARLNADEQR